MTTQAPTLCPHCGKDQAENQAGKHCTSRTCTWLKCRCGSTNDHRGMHLINGFICKDKNCARKANN